MSPHPAHSLLAPYCAGPLTSCGSGTLDTPGLLRPGKPAYLRHGAGQRGGSFLLRLSI